MMIVLVSIPNTYQSKNDVHSLKNSGVEKYSSIHSICSTDVVPDNMFILCDSNLSTCGYIHVENLSIYPKSFITLLCNNELRKHNNRIIVIECNRDAIKAIVNFYDTNQWNKEYIKKAVINNVIPIEHTQMKYREQYLFEFLDLPSYFSNEEIDEYNRIVNNTYTRLGYITVSTITDCDTKNTDHNKGTNSADCVSYEDNDIDFIDINDNEKWYNFDAREIWDDVDFGDYIL